MSTATGSTAGGRVFIADHDPNDIGVLADLLRRNGYTVEIATSGRDTLAAVPAYQPDVVLLEVDLPDIDGIEVCSALKSSPDSEHLPVIFVGHTRDQRVKVEALEKGGTDFVSRPFAPDEVLARVKRQVTVSRVRAALQESEAKFRSVTESAIDAIISADDRGAIRSWNRAATALFGFSEDEMLGQPIDRIIPESYRDAHRAGLQRVAGGGPSRVIGKTVEVAAVRKQGDEVPVELSLATWKLDGKRYFTGILRDISQRKEAEQKFRSVTESAIDAIVSSDDTSTVVAWNKAAEKTFGWTAEEMVGQPLETIIPERFRAAHRAGMNRMTQTGDSRVIGKTVELAAVRKDGTEFPIELSLSSWTVGDQRFYTGIIRDISERKEAESKLRHYADELARQHAELQEKHDELRRSREALAASYQHSQRLFSAMTDGLPGAVLNGKYRLCRKVASGGFGVVYEGIQLALDRRVAIKLLRPPTHEREEVLFERFRREGVSTCRVNHPNAVAVIDHDVSDGGFPYIVMEYLDGETLGSRIAASGPVPIGAALAIAIDVCGVLAASHRAGIIHRDIKPSNVFLQCGTSTSSGRAGVKVLDFGIAKLMDEPGLATVTRTGAFVGTPSYMPPERLSPAGETEGAWSDVYSVAVTLYESISGRLPIEPRPSLVETIEAHLRTDPPPLHDLCPAVPQELSDLVSRALARDAHQRPMADELQRELATILAALDPTADAQTPCPGSPAPPHGDATTAHFANATLRE